MLTYLIALGLTIVIELPLFVALAPPESRRRIAGDSVLINLTSHPFLHLGLSYGLGFYEGELLVILFECLALRVLTGLSWSRALLVAAGANLVTASISFLF